MSMPPQSSPYLFSSSPNHQMALPSPGDGTPAQYSQSRASTTLFSQEILGLQFRLPSGHINTTINVNGFPPSHYTYTIQFSGFSGYQEQLESPDDLSRFPFNWFSSKSATSEGHFPHALPLQSRQRPQILNNISPLQSRQPTTNSFLVLPLNSRQPHGLSNSESPFRSRKASRSSNLFAPSPCQSRSQSRSVEHLGRSNGFQEEHDESIPDLSMSLFLNLTVFLQN